MHFLHATHSGPAPANKPNSVSQFAQDLRAETDENIKHPKLMANICLTVAVLFIFSAIAGFLNFVESNYPLAIGLGLSAISFSVIFFALRAMLQLQIDSYRRNNNMYEVLEKMLRPAVKQDGESAQAKTES